MAYGNPFRPNDAIDKVLFGMECERRHEYQMQKLRTLDIEQWVSEQYE
jgi:hypothetical protein